MSTPLKILLVDDHQMFREGVKERLRREPDMEVIGEASSAQEALALTDAMNPDLAVVDIRLPGVSGIEVARQLRQKHPEIKIVILSGYDFDQYVQAAARAGIEGYLLKDTSQESLVQAIQEVAKGGVVLPPSIASKLLRDYSSHYKVSRDRPSGNLTIRELEVLELLSQGFRNSEIAQRLAISPRTAETHVSSIMAKLGAQTRLEAVNIAIEQRLIR